MVLKGVIRNKWINRIKNKLGEECDLKRRAPFCCLQHIRGKGKLAGNIWSKQSFDGKCWIFLKPSWHGLGGQSPAHDRGLRQQSQRESSVRGIESLSLK